MQEEPDASKKNHQSEHFARAGALAEGRAGEEEGEDGELETRHGRLRQAGACREPFTGPGPEQGTAPRQVAA